MSLWQVMQRIKNFRQNVLVLINGVHCFTAENTELVCGNKSEQVSLKQIVEKLDQDGVMQFNVVLQIPHLNLQT